MKVFATYWIGELKISLKPCQITVMAGVQLVYDMEKHFLSVYQYVN